MMTTSFDDRDGMIWYAARWYRARRQTACVEPCPALCRSVFEGERVYSGQIFESRAHTERLHKSARLMDFEIPYSVDEIETAKQAVMTASACATPTFARWPGAAAR